MSYGLAKELNPNGIKSLRDYAVDTYNSGGQWHGVEQNTLPGWDGTAFADFAGSYYPGFVFGSGWYDQYGEAFSEPYVNAPVPLWKFMEQLASFRIGSPSVIACECVMSADAGWMKDDVREITVDSVEDWKGNAKKKCSIPVEESYQSFLIFCPNTGGYWITSDYPDDTEERVIESDGYLDRETLLAQFQQMFPEENEDAIVSKYFHPVSI